MDLMDYRRKIIANSPHLMSASGAVATFSDGADLPLENLVVDIEPVQDLHGYDSPWVGGGGVNKIDYLSCIGIGGRDGTDSIFGNNTSISGNQLTINRPYAQGGGLLKGVGVFPMSTGDKVTISGSVTLTNTNRMYVGVGNYDGGGTNAILAVTPSSGKFVVTVTAGSDYAKTGIFLQPESANSSMVVSNVMVALGKTEKPYAPYENICPISGWNGVNLTRCGKNLWKRVSNSYPVSSYGITYSLNADGSIHVQGTASGQSNNYPIASNGMSVYAGTYTMSVKTTDPNIHFIFGGGNGTLGVAYTDMVNGSVKTFTTAGGTTGHNIIRINSGETVNGDIYIQLEEGSTATPYEPYNGVNVSIDLGQTVYGGTLNPLTGVLTVDRHWWELSTESSQWNKSSSYSGGFYTGGANYVWNWQQVKPNTPFLCSHAKTATTLSEYGANRNVCYMDNSINIRIMSDSVTKQDWIDYLTAQKSAGTPVQICCYLRNPVTIQLTPQQIRSLYGNNTIFADTGNVALEYWAHP